jgi:hypothetical protein
MIKLRMLPTIVFAILVPTLGAAAQKSKKTVPDYFPLRVGDWWTYRSSSGGTEYSQKVFSEEKQADGTIRYLMEKLAGAKVHMLFSKTGGWVLMHSESYPEHEGLEAKYEPARQYLQDPLVAHSQWGWTGEDYTKTKVTEDNRVVGFEDVAVAAGKFRAMKVVSRIRGGATITRTSWYADGVGLVKSMTDAGQIKYGFELADYSFKKKELK